MALYLFLKRERMNSELLELTPTPVEGEEVLSEDGLVRRGTTEEEALTANSDFSAALQTFHR